LLHKRLKIHHHIYRGCACHTRRAVAAIRSKRASEAAVRSSAKWFPHPKIVLCSSDFEGGSELSPLEKQLVTGHPNNLLCANSFLLQMEADAASPLRKCCEWGEQARTLP
jgi:hypothetical protein